VSLYIRKNIFIFFSLQKLTPYPVALGLVTAVLGILAVILGRKKTNIVTRIQITLQNRKLEKKWEMQTLQ
jgi:hypothetical protein